MTKKDTDLMKVADFAKEAKIAQGTVYAAIRKGFIKAVDKQRGMQVIKVVPRGELKKFKEVIRK